MVCCAENSNDGPSILCQLKALVEQIESPSSQCASPQPCSATCPLPFAQACITCPPPILAPTAPAPVKQLQLPCPKFCGAKLEMGQEEAEATRYANFYNFYNIDYKCPRYLPEPEDVQRPCENYEINRTSPNNNDVPCKQKGCPTGFKPCTMALTAPDCCNPCGVWNARVQECPPKPKPKYSAFYEPAPCVRPCCKHWKPKEGPCLYDDPCKASCLNHPPGMKPSGRYP